MQPRQQIRALDGHVGRRVRARRTQLGLSQSELARRLGLSFQQIQKYENGGNRISAGTLGRIAAALDAPVGFFFRGLGPVGPVPQAIGDGRADRMQIEVARNFARLTPRATRRAVADLVRTLAGNADLEPSAPGAGADLEPPVPGAGADLAPPVPGAGAEPEPPAPPRA